MLEEFLLTSHLLLGADLHPSQPGYFDPGRGGKRARGVCVYWGGGQGMASPDTNGAVSQEVPSLGKPGTFGGKLSDCILCPALPHPLPSPQRIPEWWLTWQAKD